MRKNSSTRSLTWRWRRGQAGPTEEQVGKDPRMPVPQGTKTQAAAPVSGGRGIEMPTSPACDLNQADGADRLRCITPSLRPKVIEVHGRTDGVEPGDYGQFSKAALLRSDLTPEVHRDRIWGVQRPRARDTGKPPADGRISPPMGKGHYTGLV